MLPGLNLTLGEPTLETIVSSQGGGSDSGVSSRCFDVGVSHCTYDVLFGVVRRYRESCLTTPFLCVARYIMQSDKAATQLCQ